MTENNKDVNIKKKIGVKDVLLLQLIVVIYTLAGVASKFAAGNPFLSWRFIMFYAIEIAVLGIYALAWQQIIKRFDLSVAYANRSIALLWAMVWAVVFFHETITWKNVLGVLIVVVGTIIVNGEDHE